MTRGKEVVIDMACSEYRPVVLVAQSDEEGLQKIIDASKRLNKFDIVATSSGQGIIDNVNKKCFDAIILGLKFSDITGATIAYLVHQFDPLVSVAFLTVYNSNILVMAAKDLGFEFWNKNEKLKNVDSFCREIYDLAIAMPCDNRKRIIKREYRKPAREEYMKYGKLTLPESILQVVQEHQERNTI